MPLVARNTYEARIEALIALGAKAGFDAFAIYGDREHAANVAYLSGYDPRFEETLLVVVPGKQPRLLVGNEGWGYAEICDGPYERVLYQTFSLPATVRRTLAGNRSLLRSRPSNHSCQNRAGKFSTLTCSCSINLRRAVASSTRSR